MNYSFYSPFFISILFFFFNMIGTISLASIKIYKSNGAVDNAKTTFDHNSILTFPENDTNLTQRNINLIKDWISIELSNDSFHSINFESIQNLGNNSYALRFTYDLNFTEYGKIYSNLLPKKVTLFSKNLLVRIKDGGIESLSTGIDPKYSNQIFKKTTDFLDQIINSQKSFFTKARDIKFRELFAILKTNQDLYHRFISKLLLVYPRLLENSWFRFFNDYQHTPTQPNQHVPSQSDQYTPPQSTGLTTDFTTALSASLNTKLTNLTTLSTSLMNLSQITTDFSKFIENFIHNLNKEKFNEILNLFFTHFINKNNVNVYLDSIDNLHLIVDLNKDLDYFRFKLIISETEIRFQSIPAETHLNDLKLFEISNVPSLNEIVVSDENIIIIHSNQLNDYLEKQNTYQLLSSIDWISLSLLFNLDFYFKQFHYERNKNKEPIHVYHGITNPIWRAENASWAFSPKSRFLIGTGGDKFFPLHKQIDILGHEYFHSVEETISNIHFSNESGAIKEHGADIIGMITSDFTLKKNNNKPSFGMGCGVLKPNEFLRLKKFKKIGSDKYSINTCLRDFLHPGQSYANQALSKQDIVSKLGPDYQKKCVGNSENDYCGAHFQSAIPNLILSQFMLELKNSDPDLTWEEVKLFTVRMVFNTFSGRLTRDIGFVSYGQHLSMECLESINRLQKKNRNIQPRVCEFLKDKFIQFNNEPIN